MVLIVDGQLVVSGWENFIYIVLDRLMRTIYRISKGRPQVAYKEAVSENQT